jgi:hypothetical protein
MPQIALANILGFATSSRSSLLCKRTEKAERVKDNGDKNSAKKYGA